MWKTPERNQGSAKAPRGPGDIPKAGATNFLCGHLATPALLPILLTSKVYIRSKEDEPWGWNSVGMKYWDTGEVRVN